MTGIRGLFGSITVKVGGAILVLAAVIAVAFFTATGIFGTVRTDLDQFRTGALPDLRTGSQLVQLTADVNEGLSALLVAHSDEAIASVESDISDHLADLHALLEREDGQRFATISDAISNNIATLAAVRRDELRDDALTLSESARLGTLIDRTLTALDDHNDSFLRDARGATQGISAIGKAIALEKLDEVNRLKHLLSVLQASVLTGASADDLDGVADAQRGADTLAENIRILNAGFAELDDITGNVETILTTIAPGTGILALRGRVVEQRETADTAVTAAAEGLMELTSHARELGQTAMAAIEGSSDALFEDVTRGRRTMWTVAAGAAAGVLLTMGVVYIAVVRPLHRITAATRRLAEGDTAPVPSFRGHGGEIEALGDAVSGMREYRLERMRRQKEEEARKVAELEAERAREAEARAAEEARRQQEIERTEAERARENAARAEQDRLQAQAEAERAEREAEQEAVVSALAAGLQGLAAGDLSHRIETIFPAAYEELRQDYNSAVGSLASLISRIAGSVDEIQGNTAEISAASEDLAKRTETSAATLEETAAAVSELTASVENAAEGARTADALTGDTNARAEASKETVGKATEAMSRIAEASDQIARITDVIDDIAFQTNLLALNAGVEAARAGEAGRGFAVVASEVRALAQRSSEAAREINELISTSTGLIRDGVKLVDNTGQVIQDIIEAVGRIAENVAAIAASAQEQASGIREINSATGELEQSMQKNAAMTQETSTASMVLSRTAAQLKEMASGFRTERDHSTSDNQSLNSAA